MISRIQQYLQLGLLLASCVLLSISSARAHPFKYVFLLLYSIIVFGMVYRFWKSGALKSELTEVHAKAKMNSLEGLSVIVGSLTAVLILARM